MPLAWSDVTPRIRQHYQRTHLLVTNAGPRQEGYTYCTRCGLIEPTADPSRLAAVEGPRRAALQFPPATALALVSGEAAPELVSQLRDVDVLGPADGRWLVRAPDHHSVRRQRTGFGVKGR